MIYLFSSRNYDKLYKAASFTFLAAIALKNLYVNATVNVLHFMSMWALVFESQVTFLQID